MNLLRSYINYVRDNPKGYWFKRKWYGWGWTPVRWQGWAVVLVMVAFIAWTSADFASSAESGVVESGTLAWFFARIALVVILLIAICYRTGEPPKWMWGIPPRAEEEKGEAE